MVVKQSSCCEVRLIVSVTWTYNALTGEVKSPQSHMSGKATYQELATYRRQIGSKDYFRVADDSGLDPQTGLTLNGKWCSRLRLEGESQAEFALTCRTASRHQSRHTGLLQ